VIALDPKNRKETVLKHGTERATEFLRVGSTAIGMPVSRPICPLPGAAGWTGVPS
jgi:hypothetical protein